MTKKDRIWKTQNLEMKHVNQKCDVQQNKNVKFKKREAHNQLARLLNQLANLSNQVS